MLRNLISSANTVLSCSSSNCNKGVCPDCGECVVFCNCTKVAP